MNIRKQFTHLIVLSLLLFSSDRLFSQTCNCTIASPSFTVTGNSSDTYVLTEGKSLLITSTGNYTGKVTLNGGTIVNAGVFSPLSTSSFVPTYPKVNTITNCGTINFTFSPFIRNLPGSQPKITINNCQAGKINVVNDAELFNHGTINNYGTIEIVNGKFGTFNSFTNYNTGYVKQSGANSDFQTEGFLYNYGVIDVLSGQECKFGGQTTNTGIINIEHNFRNYGTTYTECKINVKGDFSNGQGIFNGPKGAGKRGSLIVGGSSSNAGGTFTFPDEKMDMCDLNTPGGGWDNQTGNLFGNVTYCVNTGTGCTNICNGSGITAGPDKVLCGSGTVQLQGSGGTTYSWQPAGSLTNPNTATPTAFPTATTSYTATITKTGCASPFTDVVVVQVVPAVVANAGSDISICTGKTATIGGGPTASGGTVPYTYAWSPAGGLSSTTIANPVANAATVTYTVLVSDTKGCTAKDAMQLTLTAICCDGSGITAGPDKTICSGGNTTLQASGGNTYSWAPAGSLTNPNTATPTAFPTATTSYTATITKTGCASPFTDVVVVQVLPGVIANAGPDINVCVGKPVTIGASPTASGGTIPYTYAWSPATGLNLTTIANPTAAPATRSYTVLVSDSKGCTAKDAVQLTLTAVCCDGSDITAGPDKTICSGGSTTLQGSGGNTYSWAPVGSLTNPNTATPTAFPTVTTSYTATITKTGCASPFTDVVVVQVLPGVIANAGPDINVCVGKPVTIGASPTASGGTIPYTYAWSPATGLSLTTIANPTAAPATISYTILVSDSKGCTAKDAVQLTLTAVCCDGSGITAGPDQEICKGGTTTLHAAGGDVYSWSPATPPVSNPNIASPTASPTVTTSYTVTITKTGCSLPFTDVVVVEVTNGTIPNAGPDQTICAGQSVDLKATGGISCEWSPIEGLDPSDICTPTATPAATTLYTVKINGPGVCPFQNTDEVLITVKNNLEVTTGGDVVSCDDLGVQISASGGTSYLWAPSGTLSNAFISNPVANPGVTTTYTVTVGNGTECSGKGTVTVIKESINDVSVSSTQTTCSGDPVYLFADGGIKYLWTPSEGLSCTTCANPKAEPPTTSTYQVKITTKNGCVFTRDVTVIVEKELSVSAGPDQTACLGQEITLTATGGTNYSWNPSEGLSCDDCPDPTLPVSETREYTVTVTEGNCEAKSSVLVSLHPEFTATFTTTVLGCQASFYPSPNNLTTYEWNFGDGQSSTEINPVHNYESKGKYSVCLTVTDSCGEHTICNSIDITDCNNECE